MHLKGIYCCGSQSFFHALGEKGLSSSQFIRKKTLNQRQEQIPGHKSQVTSRVSVIQITVLR